MKEKEILIIEAAIKLFAKKGFSATSIQEIVDACSMSKGAFYLYFKSKDSLLIAVIRYYFDKIKANVEKIENNNLPPREKFQKQLQSMLVTLAENKEFIITQAREEKLPRNEEVKDVFISIHQFSISFIQQGLLSVYGEKVRTHLWDLTMLMESMFNSYVKFLFVDQLQSDKKELVPFILRIMDSIVEGITNDAPFLTESDINNLLNVAKNVLDNKNDINSLLENFKIEIQQLDNSDLLVSLKVIEDELKKEDIRKPVIQGMLSNFTEYPQLEKYITQLKKVYE